MTHGSNARSPAPRVDPLLRRLADPRVLELIILPTEHCNFRCTYCYEDFKIGRMRAEIVKALKLWIQSRADDLHLLTLAWFGGEPTLAIPTVLEVTRHGRDAMLGSRHSGARFRAGMTSNAYRLTLETFQELVQAGVTTYQITLDGPKAIHDERRLRADGQGTFDVIWRNLVGIAQCAHALPAGVEIELRVHYDGTSAGALEPLVRRIQDELLPSGMFRIHFHELERLGGLNDDAIAMATQADHQIVRNLQESLAANGGLPSQVAADMTGYVCYAARANSFVVRADGRIGKCTVALNDPRNDVGQLKDDGTIDWKEGRIDPWLRGLKTREPHVLSCPLEGMPSFLEKEVQRLAANVAAP